MTKRRYATVDVFTDQLFGGNPLAVVLDAEGLSTVQMQAIAREFNYSETTFVLPPRNPGHTAQVRIFTPRNEMPFAGHPNVGTAFLLAREHKMTSTSDGDQLVFEEKAGLVPLTLLRELGVVIGAEFRAPEALTRSTLVTQEFAASCLSLPVGDVVVTSHAPQIVSVGLPFLVVELRSRDALRRAKPNLTAYESLFPLDGADAVYAYVREVTGASAKNETVLHARMFSPLDGIVEDPATGSATAATVALLACLDRDLPAEHHWCVHQGVDMGRPSLLVGRTTVANGKVVSVYVGGCCVPVLEGTLSVLGTH